MDRCTSYPLLFLSDTYPTEMYFCMLRAFYRYANDGYILIGRLAYFFNLSLTSQQSGVGAFPLPVHRNCPPRAVRDY